MKTGYECTAYFKGIDGLGNCDDDCQWWHEGVCPCTKGSKSWDGKEHYTKEVKKQAEIDMCVKGLERACDLWDKIQEKKRIRRRRI